MGALNSDSPAVPQAQAVTAGTYGSGGSVARDHGPTIVSKDSDFHQASLLRGSPPKVISAPAPDMATRSAPASDTAMRSAAAPGTATQSATAPDTGEEG